MKMKQTILGFTIVIAVLTLSGFIETSNGQVIQEFKTDNGAIKIDYENGYIYGTAIGTANMKEMVNEIQAEQVAKTTARHLAYMVVSEAIDNITLDAKSLYRQSIQVDGILKVETQGIIRNAQVFREDFSWTNRGTPRAEVVVRIPLYGGISKAVGSWVERHRTDGPPIAKDDKKVQPSEQKYTGLIIDANGKGVKPVMVPRIVVDDGAKEIYGPAIANIEQARIMGFAGYASSLEKAKQNDRVGSNPLIIKAEKSHGIHGGDLVVSEVDAAKILSADMKEKFLKECRLVIVVD